LEVIAESVQDDARQALPLWFLETGLDNLPRSIAAHSLAVAQVIAQVTRCDKHWHSGSFEAIMAALIHDVGMLKLPTTLLRETESLNDEQRRAIEAHPILGADMAARITPSADWIIDAAAQHHERVDGTGYPAGLRDLQIKPLVRLLSVCDAYAAMRQLRPHRLALDPRTALVDTLLMADRGDLDRTQAELLLRLGHYPVGTKVELSDGAVGDVVATHQLQHDLNASARPVVAVWIDAARRRLPRPRHIDLAERNDLSILRGIPAAVADYLGPRESTESQWLPALSRRAS
jgi:HD-GYP domain-containing protein (c-di-GMP phosphodiesterase class II)